MERNVSEIHDEILQIFRKIRRSKPDFKFTLRKSDINKRLSLGYWFHGNEDYISISFWTGLDWVRKVPNISLMINIETGNMTLEFSAKDSEEKQKLINETFSERISLNNPHSYLYIHDLQKNFYEDPKLALKHFLDNEKKTIDDLLAIDSRKFLTKQNPKNRIGFISDEDFSTNLTRVRRFELKKKSQFMPYGISSLWIKCYDPSGKMVVQDIPADAQWIFITGDNNSGKTTFLKTIALGICNGTIPDGPTHRLPKNYSITLELNKDGKKTRQHTIDPNTYKRSKPFEVLSKGFAAYGPIRLNIRDLSMQANERYLNILKKPYRSLFNTFASLIDVGYVYSKSGEFPDEVRIDKEKYHYITTTIIQLCESIVDIQFGKVMRFFVKAFDEPDREVKALRFEQLSSGYRNLIAMVSDMMLHLFYQQPDIDDPSELVGIVIIDEIDLHFHPKMQKQLIKKMTELFPRIQFIVSTHSPIPLLGAPDNSVFIKVERINGSITAERLDKKIPIKKLLPNALLSSPLFDLEDFAPIDKKINELLTSDNYEEALYFYLLSKRFDQYNKNKND